MHQTMTPGRTSLYVAAAGAAVMFLGAILSLFDGRNEVRLSAPAAAATTVYVTRPVRIRSAPTAQGSAILGELARGEMLTGEWVTGADGVEWLKVSRSGGDAYVWGRNLSFRPRPQLGSAIESERTVRRTTAVTGEPDGAGARLDTLTPGLRVTAVGVTTGGELELAMRQGGVGYIPLSAAR